MAAAFFGNSGAEANEGLLKLARKYSHDKYGAGRGTILTLRRRIGEVAKLYRRYKSGAI